MQDLKPFALNPKQVLMVEVGQRKGEMHDKMESISLEVRV